MWVFLRLTININCKADQKNAFPQLFLKFCASSVCQTYTLSPREVLKQNFRNSVELSGIPCCILILILNTVNFNANYFEQFTKIINAALPVSNQIGNPLKALNIEGVATQKYRFNSINTDSAIFPFTKVIEGNNVKKGLKNM